MINTFYTSYVNDFSSIANWNTSKVTSMYGMFTNCSNLTNISFVANWNISNVKYMNEMFENCNSLTNISSIANWNSSIRTNMYRMFYNDINLCDIKPLFDNRTFINCDMCSLFSINYVRTNRPKPISSNYTITAVNCNLQAAFSTSAQNVPNRYNLF